jgi:hypothetical protein
MSATITLAFGSLALSSTNNVTIARISEKASKPVQTTNIPCTDGAIAETAKIGPKTITVEGDVCGSSYDDLRTNIDALHAGLLNGLQKFTKDNERYIYAQLKDFSFAYDHMTRRATWTAQFVAHFPFWLSTTLKSDNRAPTSGTGYTVTNNGNAPTRLKLTLTCASNNNDNMQFENTTRGELAKYRAFLSNNQPLVIDNRVSSDDFAVTNNGTSDFANFEGDFLNLNAGNNTFEYTGTVPATMLLHWFDAWY